MLEWEEDAMDRLPGFDYKTPFYYMVTVKKEGLKRESLVESQSVSLRTIARLLADLEHEGKIICRGSKKTGGYCAVKQED